MLQPNSSEEVTRVLGPSTLREGDTFGKRAILLKRHVWQDGGLFLKFLKTTSRIIKEPVLWNRSPGERVPCRRANCGIFFRKYQALTHTNQIYNLGTLFSFQWRRQGSSRYKQWFCWESISTLEYWWQIVEGVCGLSFQIRSHFLSTAATIGTRKMPEGHTAWCRLYT